MRLTLRTLLAYLDDTLDAAMIKEIGAKVAESDAAQELIGRLKQVTRRRRLTVPPATGPDAFDANDVADYLDNELPSDQVAELEKQCLESDVHLAEIAACHQILTLVLGEPALAPPKAKERMYALVQGREAIRSRKAAPPKKAKGDALDEDEALGLGGAWLRWVLPAAGVLLLVVLALGVYQVLPESKQGSGDQTVKKPGPEPDAVEKPSTKTKGDNTDEKKQPVEPDETKDKSKIKDKLKEQEPDKVKIDKKVDVTKGKEDGLPAPEPPSMARVEAATYTGAGASLPTYLLARKVDETKWVKVEPKSRVQTSDTLMALPGFVAHLKGRTGAGADLYLRGSLPEFNLVPSMRSLLESVVVLHENKNFDLDLTLVRGRIFIRNQRRDDKACKVRLRFDDETWDLTLDEEGDEIGVDLYREYTPLNNPRKGEKPVTTCTLAILKGHVGFAREYKSLSVKVKPGKFALMTYDSSHGVDGPRHFDEPPLLWKLEPPPQDVLPDGWKKPVAEINLALKSMEALLSTRSKDGAKPVSVACSEMREEKGAPLAKRLLAVYCLGAVDEVERVLTVLKDETLEGDPDRKMACKVLTHWASRGPDTYKKLADDEGEGGLLRGAGLKPKGAVAARDLFYSLQLEDLRKVETYESLANLLTKQPIVAELAYWHLTQLVPPGKMPPGFNASLEPALRDAYARKIHEMVEKKQLPPGGAVEKTKE